MNQTHPNNTDFWRFYRNCDFTIDRTALSWLKDFADYWSLPAETLPFELGVGGSPAESAEVKAVVELLDGGGRVSSAQVGRLIARLAGFEVQGSAFFRSQMQKSVMPGEMPQAVEDFFELAGSAWRVWLEHTPRAMRPAVIGCGERTKRRFFPNGLFDMKQAPDRQVVAADGSTLIFEGGDCFVETLRATPAMKNFLLVFLKEAENAVRARWKRTPLRNAASTSVKEAFREVEAQRKAAAIRAANPARKIQFERLAAIRSDADANRDRLVLAEELNEGLQGLGGLPELEVSGIPEAAQAEAPSSIAEPSAAPAIESGLPHQDFGGFDDFDAPVVQASAAVSGVFGSAGIDAPVGEPSAGGSSAGDSEDGLSPAIREALERLLKGDPSGITATGLSPAMFVDRVNELLFDQVGDAVLELGPDGPAVIEDYADDLSDIIA